MKIQQVLAIIYPTVLGTNVLHCYTSQITTRNVIIRDIVLYGL